MYNAQAQETERLIQDLRHRMARVEKRVTLVGQSDSMLWQNAGTGGGSGGGGGGSQFAYWCMAPVGGFAASTGTFPAITPSTATLAVYTDVGGALTLAGTAVCRWFYRDACPQYRLVPLQPNNDGSFDCIANSCTVVSP